MKTVLIATSGRSPAILTETVWALAQESPPMIPDEVVVITTVTGKQLIQEKLLDSGVWRELRSALLEKKARLKFNEGNIRVVYHPESGEALDALGERVEHTAFADAIMHELWAYTSQPDTRVIASLAGGFKTMSALMHSSMQLLAKPGDRLTHVLVSDGLDNPGSGFFFPQNKKQAKSVQLIDIPLIPLRQWFRDLLKQEPPSYETLLTSSIEAMWQRIGELKLELSSPKAKPLWLKLNGVEQSLEPGQYAYLSFFVKMKIKGETTDSAWEDIQDWIEKLYKKHDQFHVLKDNLKKFRQDNFDKRLSALRVFLKKELGSDGEQLANALPKGSRELKLLPENLKIQNGENE